MTSRGLTHRASALGRVFQSAVPHLRSNLVPQWRRTFGSEAAGGSGPPTKGSGSGDDVMMQLNSLLPADKASSTLQARINHSFLDRNNSASVEDFEPSKKRAKTSEPWHFHVYSHKHNTHITVTKPDHNPVISLSCGNLGFKKSGRKHYDSAYQLGAYVIDKLQQMGKHKEIDSLEVCLRGFGLGREAVTKVLLGNEGRLLRPKITRVTDATRLKFGGTRSRNPRRLG